jgi:hypothetical protein
MSRVIGCALAALVLASLPAHTAVAQWPEDNGGRGSTAGLTFRPGDRMVTLTWLRADATSQFQYHVFRSADTTSVGADLSGALAATTFVDKTAELGKFYFYHVVAQLPGANGKPRVSAPLRFKLEQPVALELAGKAPAAQQKAAAPPPPAPTLPALTVAGFMPSGVRANVPAPTGGTFSPTGEPTITIMGSGFTRQTAIAVYFTGESGQQDQPGRIESHTDVRIVAVVPAGARWGAVKVVLGAGVSSEYAISAQLLRVKPPLAITRFDPPSGRRGDMVRLIVQGAGESFLTVRFGGPPPTGPGTGDVRALRMNDTAYGIRITPDAATGKVWIHMAGSSSATETATSAMDFTVLPTPVSLDSISPASAAVGAMVVLKGYGHVSPVVTFPGGKRAVVVSTVDGAITPKGRLSVTTVQVPAGATSGPITLTSSGTTVTSSSAFTIKP